MEMERAIMVKMETQ